MQLVTRFVSLSVEEDADGRLSKMNETITFQVSHSAVQPSTDDKRFKASMPLSTTFSVLEYPYDPPPRQSVATATHVTKTTIIIAGCVVMSCVILALLVAAFLKHKRSRIKRWEDGSKMEFERDKQSAADEEIYSEIEPKNSGCWCVYRRDMYSVTANDHIDNIYAELSDVAPTPHQHIIDTGKEVIYETLDGKDWSRSRSKSQGANETPKRNKPPRIYDHLSFQEEERIRLGNAEHYIERRKIVRSAPEQMSTAYDRLDRSHHYLTKSDDIGDPDGNNNSLVRRLSAKQILKKLFVVQSDQIQKKKLTPPKRHDFLEILNVPAMSEVPGNEDVDLGHEYFVLEDKGAYQGIERDKRRNPCVPIQTCYLRSFLHGERCVSFPGSYVAMSRCGRERRVRSFPEHKANFSSRDPIDHISTISSRKSSEGVYNIKTGHVHKFSSDGHQHGSEVCLRSRRNEYFLLDPVFIDSDVSARTSASQSENQHLENTSSVDTSSSRMNDPEDTASFKQPSASGYGSDYFVLESEAGNNFQRPPRFRIVEANSVPSFNHPHFARQVSEPNRQDSGGVTVVKLKGAGNDDTPGEHVHESLYDKLRFKCVSEKQKLDFRPRLLSTPNNIDF